MFSDVAMALGADDAKDARGMAVADFDNDGDLDIVINTNKGDIEQESVPPALLRNDIGQARNSIVFQLTGSQSNRDALGAVVRIEVPREADEPLTLTRHVYCGSGYASQNDLRLFFGLGDLEHISKAEIQWPSGLKQVITNEIEANQVIKVTEGETPKKGELVAR